MPGKLSHFDPLVVWWLYGNRMITVVAILPMRNWYLLNWATSHEFFNFLVAILPMRNWYWKTATVYLHSPAASHPSSLSYLWGIDTSGLQPSMSHKNVSSSRYLTYEELIPIPVWYSRNVRVQFRVAILPMRNWYEIIAHDTRVNLNNICRYLTYEELIPSAVFPHSK